MQKLKTVGVHVFLEKRKTRREVGILKREGGKFIFTYGEQYFRADNVIPLGPEFPLTQEEFTSEKLFPSLQDRIPLIQNPAYPDYCFAMGIEPTEQDPLVLLSTIGRRGPSSFIFFPILERKVTAENVIQFRKALGLTTREFAAVFELSQSSLNALERNRIVGNEIIKRLEILLKHPKVALELLRLNGGYLIEQRWGYAIRQLVERCKAM